MLVDTGADVSLVDSSELSDTERKSLLQGDKKKLKGAGGESIRVEGVIYKAVVFGRKEVRNHPFRVVSHCVVKAVAGRDLLRKLGELTWDWRRRKLRIHSTGDSIALEALQRPTEGKGLGEQEVLLADGVRIPPRSEKVVRGKIVGPLGLNGEFLVEGHAYLGSVMIARSIVAADVEGNTLLRLMNTGDEEKELKAGLLLGKASVQYQIRSEGTSSVETKTGSWFIMGPTLTTDQKKELLDVLKKHESVFWEEGKPLGGMKYSDDKDESL